MMVTQMLITKKGPRMKTFKETNHMSKALNKEIELTLWKIFQIFNHKEEKLAIRNSDHSYKKAMIVMWLKMVKYQERLRRSNWAKARNPPGLILESDRILVFSNL